VVKVSSELEAAAIVYASNIGNHDFSLDERKALSSQLLCCGVEVENICEAVGPAARRKMIEAQLLADATRTDRQIARKANVGSHHRLVAEVRAELESRRQISKPLAQSKRALSVEN
jgi:hypothetical protein